MPPWDRMLSSASASSSPVVTPALVASRSSCKVSPTSRPATRIRSICSGVLISSDRSSRPISGRSGLGYDVEGVEDPLGDLFDDAHAVDLVDDATPAVDLDQRLGLLGVDLLTAPDDLLSVIRAAFGLRAV